MAAMDKPTERGPKCQRGTSRTSGLSSGERAPDFVAPLEGAGPARFYGRAGGRPALVIFAAGVCALTRAALDAAGDIATRHLVVPDEAEAAPLPEVDLFRDDGKLRAAAAPMPGSSGTGAGWCEPLRGRPGFRRRAHRDDPHGDPAVSACH